MFARLSSSQRVSANERFKSKSGDLLSIGVIAAVIAHIGLFVLCPDVQAAETRGPIAMSVVIHRRPEVDIPPPPQQVDGPPPPRVAAAILQDGPYPYRYIPPGRTRPDRFPSPRAGARPEDEPSYVPRDQEPVLRNRGELIRELQRRYPAMLREAGIGGTVGVYLYVSETGEVTRTELQRPSEQPAFDSVAVEVALDAEFTPASNRDEPVGVWIRLPFQFGTR